MNASELQMYKLAAQHVSQVAQIAHCSNTNTCLQRLDKTPLYKTKHRAVLQAMVRAADICLEPGPDSMGVSPVSPGTPPSMPPPPPSRSASLPPPPRPEPRPVQRASTLRPQPANAPQYPMRQEPVSYGFPQVSQQQSSVPPRSLAAVPVMTPAPLKSKYKKAKQQPVFLVTSGTQSSLMANNYMPLEQQPAGPVSKFGAEQGAMAQHIEYSNGGNGGLSRLLSKKSKQKRVQ